MKKEHAILVLFIILSTALVLRFFASSPSLETKGIDAGGFGIAPPFIKIDDMRPGERYEKSIRVMRVDTGGEQKVTARFDALDVDDWITIEPADTLVLKEGEDQKKFNFIIDVPKDAYKEKHLGRLYFAISAEHDDSGVAIALGAKAEVELVLGEGRKPASELRVELSDDSLVERLQGSFIMRPEAGGQLYYMAPNKRMMYSISKPEDFSTMLREEARGINNELLSMIRVNIDYDYGLASDSDDDGLIDRLEEALGTDMYSKDTDQDGFGDKVEVAGGFSPLQDSVAMPLDDSMGESLAGYLLLQVEDRGQVWYIDLDSKKRLLLVDINNNLDMIEGLAIGISEENFHKLLKN